MVLFTRCPKYRTAHPTFLNIHISAIHKNENSNQTGFVVQTFNFTGWFDTLQGDGANLAQSLSQRISDLERK